MKFSQLCLVVVPYRSVVAFPLSYTSAVSATSRTYVPLIVIFICLFFLLVFLAIKFVYMKHRRMGTIHAPHDTTRPTTSSLDKQGNRHRGFLVGCLGSPAWETNLTSKLDEAWRRKQRGRSSFAYQLHTQSTRSARAKTRHSSSGSCYTKSTTHASCSSHADQLVLLPSSASSRVTSCRGSSSSKALLSVQRHTSTNGHFRYGDFGELHGARSPGCGIPNVARRASPCSIRLVDGPSDSNQVDYAFLSALPPDAVTRSPLMGTRDSIQLCRCSLKCPRKPAPPLPSLPLFLPFHLPKGPEAVKSYPLQGCEYLPPLRFSPLASVARVFHSQHHIFEKRTPGGRVSDADESKGVVSPCMVSASWSKTRNENHAGPSMSPCLVQETTIHPIRKTNTRSGHKRSLSCQGLAIGGSLPQTRLVTGEGATLPPEDKRHAEMGPTPMDVLRTRSSSSRSGRGTPKKPLKSCLRQRSIVLTPFTCSPGSTLSPLMSETSMHTRQSTGDQISVQTPISDDDIGMLGLDRFQWSNEIKEFTVQSCHTKKDSGALIPLWE